MTDQSAVTEGDLVAQQAAQWLARRHSGQWNMTDRLALEAWLNASSQHRHVYEQVSQMWRDLDAAKGALDSFRLAARQYRPQQSAKPRRSLPAGMGIAASLLLAFGAGYWYWIGFESHYLTARGESKTVTLADGSSVRLNTDSELTVRFNAGHRLVELRRGEALFTVIHDAGKPFIVAAGAGEIKDIGTRFNVYRQADRVAVSVLEGSVQITGHDDPLTLAAGQAVAYDLQGRLLPHQPIDIAAVTAWLEGTLVFSDTPLPEVVAQLSRYHAVSFDMADPKLARIKISGSFQADNLSLMLKTLQASFPIKLTQLDGEHIRIQPR